MQAYTDRRLPEKFEFDSELLAHSQFGRKRVLQPLGV